MTHDIARRLRLSGLMVLLSVTGAGALSGQDPRDVLIDRASNEFDAARRVQLLVSALNPKLGPPRGRWGIGVQLLAQTLIEDRKDSLATVWLRWAARQAPDLQPDSVQFLPSVVAAVRAARAFVLSTSSPRDSGAATSWQWPAQETGASGGTLRVTSTGLVPVRAEVLGVGPVDVGGSLSLGPGSYQISASASGYDSLRVTREVLPGITTVVELHLRSTFAQVTPPPPPPGAQQVAPTQKKKKFPIWLVAGGVAGVAAAAVLLGGPKPQPTTGSITITFPNP